MPDYVDQLNREVTVTKKPLRIISLVPSQTELLFDLGLDEEVIGITKFCVNPNQWFIKKTRIGGTKNLHLQKIRELQPDLIIANKEENVQEQIEELASDFPVWVSDVNTLNDALKMIESIGKIVDRKLKAELLITRIETNFLEHQQPISKKLQTCYLIWKEPYMTVGGDTFIHDMLARAGFSNIFQHKQRYPQVIISQLTALKCELLLLSSEPYPFRQNHIHELQAQLPGIKIILVDGEMFSWYGSRLLKAPEYFTHLNHQIATIM